jgi:HEAT repeat protein
MGPAAAPAVPRLEKFLKAKDKDKGWASAAYSALKAIGTPEASRLVDDNPPWIVAPR